MTSNKIKRAREERVEKLRDKIKAILMSPVRLFKTLCFITGVITMLLIMIVTTYFITFFNSLPDLNQYGFKKLKKEAISRTHKRFESSRKKKNYRWTPIRVVSRDLLYSVVMSEDGHFFDHQGVNYDAMIDSLARNIKEREYVSGGSTISQQVVKNVFLTHERSILRKLKEILITQDLEKYFTKNQILEIYLNIVEFGPDIYGIRMASSYYFKKKPSKINAVEGTFMALMLPSPRKYHHSIYVNKYLSKRHRRKMYRVLRDLLGLELISPKQYNRYRKSYIFKKFR